MWTESRSRQQRKIKPENTLLEKTIYTTLDMSSSSLDKPNKKQDLSNIICAPCRAKFIVWRPDGAIDTTEALFSTSSSCSEAACHSTNMNKTKNPTMKYTLLSYNSISSLKSSCCICGDINGNNYYLLDISDVTFLVNYIFNGGLEPPNFCCADVNGSGGDLIDISDLTFATAYLFGGGLAPICSCQIFNK